MFYHYTIVELVSPFVPLLRTDENNLPQMRELAAKLPERTTEYFDVLERLFKDGWFETGARNGQERRVHILAHRGVVTGEQAEERLRAVGVTNLRPDDDPRHQHLPAIETGFHSSDDIPF